MTMEIRTMRQARRIADQFSSALNTRNRLKHFKSAGGELSSKIRENASVLSKWAVSNVNALWREPDFKSSRPLVDVIDMFCGSGGMSAGFHALNKLAPIFRLAGAIDIDKDSADTYERNYSVRPEHIDISSLAASTEKIFALLNYWKVDRKRPLILIGCSPCQGFSSHRNDRGASDNRNNLFLDFIKIATTIKPDVILMENVPEILTGNRWPFVAKARKKLQDSGYYVHISYHNTATFGVPQNRFRALLIAMRKPFSPLPYVFTRSEYRSVRHSIANLPPLVAGERCEKDEMHYTVKHKPSTVKTIRQVPPDGGNLPLHAGPPCLRRAFLKHGKRIYEDVYGRLRWDSPSITITAHARNPASGRFVHPEQDRGISVREAALLQGFPDSFWFAGTLDSRFRQVGNAVPPMFSICLAIHVLAELISEESPHFSPGVEQSIGESFSRVIPALKKL